MREHSNGSGVPYTCAGSQRSGWIADPPPRMAAPSTAFISDRCGISLLTAAAAQPQIGPLPLRLEPQTATAKRRRIALKMPAVNPKPACHKLRLCQQRLRCLHGVRKSLSRLPHESPQGPHIPWPRCSTHSMRSTHSTHSMLHKAHGALRHRRHLCNSLTCDSSNSISFSTRAAIGKTQRNTAVKAKDPLSLQSPRRTRK